MPLTRIHFQDFKRLEDAAIDLGPITVLVGGNNSGKSCVLQGAHFGVSLLQSARSAASRNFYPEKLRYCPTEDFLDIRHGSRLTEGNFVRITYQRKRPSTGVSEEYPIKLTRGRNGVVSVQYADTGSFYEALSDVSHFFSIYVPGLAGIPLREEFRSDLVVNNGIARGDANLYLRNVLLRIQTDQPSNDKFHAHLNAVFPGIRVVTEFDHGSDLHIRSRVRFKSGISRPVDTVGTGVLQAVQLLAYVMNYNPSILLLDEPDAHLHPNNQRLLGWILKQIVEETESQIILATHSRHLLDSLTDSPNTRIIWLRDGSVQPEPKSDHLAVLMDLGALDEGERFYHGQYKVLVWTEDSDLSKLECLLEANGFNLNETMVYSYQSSNKLDAAAMLARFAKDVRHGIRIVIHRDRDFMTDDEVEMLRQRYEGVLGDGVELFITDDCDVESYFIRPGHIAESTGVPPTVAEHLVEQSLIENNTHLAIKYREKRECIKRELYRDKLAQCPHTDDLIPQGQLSADYAVGKALLKLVAEKLQNAHHVNPAALIHASSQLGTAKLREIATSVWPQQNGDHAN